MPSIVMLDTYQVEYTDTFGGEANYCWVDRKIVRARNLKHAFRIAKKAMRLNGFRGRTYNHGDTIEFRPYRMCTVLFVTWSDV